MAVADGGVTVPVDHLAQRRRHLATHVRAVCLRERFRGAESGFATGLTVHRRDRDPRVPLRGTGGRSFRLDPERAALVPRLGRVRLLPRGLGTYLALSGDVYVGPEGWSDSADPGGTWADFRERIQLPALSATEMRAAMIRDALRQAAATTVRGHRIDVALLPTDRLPSDADLRHAAGLP